MLGGFDQVGECCCRGWYYIPGIWIRMGYLPRKSPPVLVREPVLLAW